jgi:D-apiose dehydrogenase
MKSPPLKGVLIGAGFFARYQAEAWQRISAAHIAAVADPVPGKAAAFAEQFNIPRADINIEEMLCREKPDFVDVATRPEPRLELVRLAASMGIQVICQKPMAPGWDDCLAMVDLCEKAGVRLLIHENWRWQPWYRETKKIIQSERLGPLFQIAFQWRTGDGRGPDPYPVQPYFKEMPRFLVYESLVHILDTFRYLGGDLSRVYCQNRKVNNRIAGEDHSLIQVTFETGMPGLIDANRISGPPPAPVAMGAMTVEGDRALLRVAPDGRIHLQDHGREEMPHPFSPPETGYKGDSVHATQLHLIECLLSGMRSESEGRDYLKTVAAMEACYTSAATGQPQQFFTSPF